MWTGKREFCMRVRAVLRVTSADRMRIVSWSSPFAVTETILGTAGEDEAADVRKAAEEGRTISS
jgi:hypothetical protein